MSAEAADRDALVVGLSVVPGLYSRNRMFSLFQRNDVRRARARASQIRGVVRQLSGARGPVELCEWTRSAEGARLVFAVPAVSFERRIDLSAVEAACLAWLCSRAKIALLPCTAEDRAVVEGALRRLGADALARGVADAPAGSRLPAHDERRLPLLQDPAGRDPEPEGARD